MAEPEPNISPEAEHDGEETLNPDTLEKGGEKVTEEEKKDEEERVEETFKDLHVDIKEDSVAIGEALESIDRMTEDQLDDQIGLILDQLSIFDDAGQSLAKENIQKTSKNAQDNLQDASRAGKWVEGKVSGDAWRARSIPEAFCDRYFPKISLGDQRSMSPETIVLKAKNNFDNYAEFAREQNKVDMLEGFCSRDWVPEDRRQAFAEKIGIDDNAYRFRERHFKARVKDAMKKAFNQTGDRPGPNNRALFTSIPTDSPNKAATKRKTEKTMLVSTDDSTTPMDNDDPFRPVIQAYVDWIMIDEEKFWSECATLAKQAPVPIFDHLAMLRMMQFYTPKSCATFEWSDVDAVMYIRELLLAYQKNGGMVWNIFERMSELSRDEEGGGVPRDVAARCATIALLYLDNFKPDASTGGGDETGKE